MFESLWLRVKRRQRAILWTSGLIALGYVLYGALADKLRRVHARMLKDRADRDTLSKRFSQNQEDAVFTVMALLPSLMDPMLDDMQVENITKELQKRRGGSEGSTASSDINTSSNTETASESGDRPLSKIELWSRLKIEALTRALTFIHAMAVLIVYTRLQLNLLGRRSYVAAVRGETDFDVDISRQFLTFSWWFLNSGWREIQVSAEKAVRETVNDIDPRAELSVESVLDLFDRMQSAMAQSNYISGAVTAPADQESFILDQAERAGRVEADQRLESDSISVLSGSSINTAATEHRVPSEPLRQLLNEAADFMESPHAAQTVNSLARTGMAVLLDRIRSSSIRSSSSDANKGPPQRTLKFATVLATTTRQAHVMAHGQPNEYVMAMDKVPELDAFSAVVYSSWS
ncbi:hypothetical protein CANCADRAFT_106388 [Tortispora caseinolytica NRRL Y-17796]|uniref:Peroxin-3 n=1 Tax=Tortispora caseinolytica NRRL Y-17796 TaxID=767744 RepID=A0A1E4TFG7_9ASCO|nr:hypothetical protein CANCADRAFT_106388 [Tortispora caseinolytica NRRL Y-17796]